MRTIFFSRCSFFWRALHLLCILLNGFVFCAGAANSSIPLNQTLAGNSTSTSTATTSNQTSVPISSNYVGVNWGTLSSDPLPGNVTVRILQESGFTAVKFFSAPPEYLRALANSSIEVQVLMPLDQVQNVSSYNQSLVVARANAVDWVTSNVLNWRNQGVNITSLAVGNEPFVMGENVTYGAYVLPALRSVYYALQQLSLNDTVKLTVPMDAGSTFGNTYPPSASEFNEPMKPILLDMAAFLAETGSFLTVNLYPFVSLKYDPTLNIDFAVGRGSNGFTDQGYNYSNLLLAQIDATYVAMDKLFPKYSQNISVQIGETGWPSDGGLGATPGNASDYLTYSVTPLASGQGTPRYPNRPVKTYIFALYDEDLKYTQGIGDYELHWGLLYANGTAKYAGNSTTAPSPSNSGVANPPVSANGTSQANSTWCIADATADPQALVNGLNYACGPGSANCTAIQPGGSCFVPLGATNRLQFFASYAYNDYYQQHKTQPGSCVFGNTALLTTTDPSPSSTCTFRST